MPDLSTLVEPSKALVGGLIFGACLEVKLSAGVERLARSCAACLVPECVCDAAAEAFVVKEVVRCSVFSTTVVVSVFSYWEVDLGEALWSKVPLAGRGGVDGLGGVLFPRDSVVLDLDEALNGFC